MPMRPARSRIFVREIDYYDDRARGLLAVLPDGVPEAVAQVRAWHPRFADAADEVVRAAHLTLDDARLVYARQHGFPDWSALARHLAGLDDEPAAEPFLVAFEAARRGDWTRATATLRANPELVREAGTNGNTMLNLACSLAPCASPKDAGEARLASVALLLGAGADVNRANDRGWTPLHQAAYRNDPAMAELLLAAGARTDRFAHGDGGSPLAVALFWGHREVAGTLARHGVVPANLRVAAGLGRLDLLECCFAPDGALTPAARAGRAFYRPHSGFPAWRPTDDAQEVLDEALVWAAKSGRIEAMALLVARGADVGADPYRGTPLAWAAANGRVDAVAWLLDHGASPDRRGGFGGSSHGQGVTALHLAAQHDHADVVGLLLSRGADATVEDALFESTPAGWARHFDARAALAILKSNARS
jgi:ankyrin repeat protein